MTTEDLDAIWQQLETTPVEQGLVYRRLHPDSGRDLRAALNPAGRERALLFSRPWRPADRLPRLLKLRAVELTTNLERGGSRLVLAVTLKDRAFADVFSVLASDIVDAAAAAPGDAEATLALVARLERWRELLDRIHEEGLSSTFRRGLFGEVHILQQLLVPALGARVAVEGWTGPSRANQDFQYEHAAVEVKVTAGQQPQSLVVANEREFDETGVGSLYLAHLSLDERKGGEGLSLNEAVETLQRAVGSDATVLSAVRERLIRYGYLDSQRQLYDEPRYSLRDCTVYRVSGDFPRITEALLPLGVGAVRYSVSLAACQPHRVAVDELVEGVQGPTDESRT